MRISAILVGALRAGNGARLAPAVEPPPANPPIVIVHGAWGGSWAFRKVEALLGTCTQVVHRVSLTGLGERGHLATPEIGRGTSPTW